MKSTTPSKAKGSTPKQVLNDPATTIEVHAKLPALDKAIVSLFNTSAKLQKSTRLAVSAFFKALALSGLSQEDSWSYLSSRFDSNYSRTGIKPLLNKKNIESARVYRVLDANPAYASNTAQELLSFANRAVKSVKMDKAIEIAQLVEVDVDGVKSEPTLNDLHAEVTKAKPKDIDPVITIGSESEVPSTSQFMAIKLALGKVVMADILPDDYVILTEIQSIIAKKMAEYHDEYATVEPVAIVK